MATGNFTPNVIDPVWLARYVSKTGISDSARISNAWRQQCHRERRKTQLSALRRAQEDQGNQEALRNTHQDQGDQEPLCNGNDDRAAYEAVTNGCRRNDPGLLLEMIRGIYPHGCPADCEPTSGIDHALSILRLLRNTSEEEIARCEEYKKQVLTLELLRNVAAEQKASDKEPQERHEIALPSPSAERSIEVHVSHETLCVPAIGYSQIPPMPVPGFDDEMAYEFNLPEGRTKEKIDNYLSALPLTERNAKKQLRALTACRKKMSEDLKRMELEKSAGYPVLREPTNFDGKVG